MTPNPTTYPKGNVRCTGCAGCGRRGRHLDDDVVRDGGLVTDTKECGDCKGRGYRPPTDADVAELKRQWTRDPCWDIEHTEGFEDLHDALQLFATQWFAFANVRAERDRLKSEAEALRKQALGVDRRAQALDDTCVFLRTTHDLGRYG